MFLAIFSSVEVPLPTLVEKFTSHPSKNLQVILPKIYKSSQPASVSVTVDILVFTTQLFLSNSNWKKHPKDWNTHTRNQAIRQREDEAIEKGREANHR